MVVDLASIVRDPAAQGAALRRESVVAGWPEDPDECLRAIVAELDDLDRVRVFAAEFEHYHCGYASFVEVKLTRRGGLLVRRVRDSIETRGFGLLLNRLAPIAVLQADAHESRSTDGLSGSGTLPGPESMAAYPLPGFPESVEVANTLSRFGYTLIEPDVLSGPIADGLEPETNLSDPPWQVFDAWFYWFD